MKETNTTCELRIDAHLGGRIADLTKLWDAYRSGKEDADLGTLADYGLCFDYVAPGTFDDQPEGYFRYQLSWGGPSDEFRFFVNPDLTCHRIDYWFMDWFDGAHRALSGETLRLMLALWCWFEESGAARTALQEAGVSAHRYARRV